MNQVPLKNDPRAIEWLVDSIAVAQALKVKIILRTDENLHRSLSRNRDDGRA